MLTLVAIALYLGLFIARAILWAIFLRVGLKWVRVPEVTTRRIVVATASVIIVQLVINILFLVLSPAQDEDQLIVGGLQFVIAVLAAGLVLRRVFKTGFFRSLQAWLPTVIPTTGMVLIMLFVVRPFIFETFFLPTNSMAPTLLGYHRRSTCPQCGRPNFGAPLDSRFAPPDRGPMICENFHVHQIRNELSALITADRILVAKFLTPRRWDIVVFQYPEQPSTLHAKRLIGLPGETIHIEDGAVWADGKKLTPPNFVNGIEYQTDPFGPPARVAVSQAHPAVLGPDEYFVLGDFSAQSYDSRFWERGAPGHAPFAVPESYLRGVVTHIYWPPQRWRILPR